MATPFDNTSAPADIATNNQLDLIQRLLGSQNWHLDTLPAKYVSRAAVLNLVIGWVMGAAEVPMDVRKHINAGAMDGENVNALLAAANAGGEHAYNWAPLTKAGASKLIDWLKSVPGVATAEPVAAPSTPEGVRSFMSDTVPAGRYAIDTQVHAVNGTAFYKVDRPTEGRWAGRVFVKQLIGPEEQRLSQKQSHGIIAKIAEAGAEAAAARYGHEIGECGMCGRQLTNDESRARGIGPVCAAKAGW